MPRGAWSYWSLYITNMVLWSWYGGRVWSEERGMGCWRVDWGSISWYHECGVGRNRASSAFFSAGCRRYVLRSSSASLSRSTRCMWRGRRFVLTMSSWRTFLPRCVYAFRALFCSVLCCSVPCCAVLHPDSMGCCMMDYASI